MTGGRSVRARLVVLGALLAVVGVTAAVARTSSVLFASGAPAENAPTQELPAGDSGPDGDGAAPIEDQPLEQDAETTPRQSRTSPWSRTRPMRSRRPATRSPS